jgi:hypothetical protein
MSDKIKVRITAESKIRISQIRQIPREAWEKYQAMCERAATDREFNNAFEGYIHPDDILDTDDWEELRIELVK